MELKYFPTRIIAPFDLIFLDIFLVMSTASLEMLYYIAKNKFIISYQGVNKAMASLKKSIMYLHNVKVKINQ